ncbi:MAG: quinolinate synthase NadA [Planctomycetes bacterium]|nr:quinolinate synthase NadA [Planctomycetota bacterium]
MRTETPSSPTPRFLLQPELPVCQTDLPLDWYQEEFKPYAEEYLALPNRRPETLFRWLDGYVKPAQAHFGDGLLLLAHFYMGGEIVKLVEHYGGAVADSYQLALQARNRPEKRVIVESAVHFMAEAIAILAHPEQSVWITNPKAGCTMEMLAKDYMVLPVADQLVERYGDTLATVAYMNTSGRLKALAGRTGGAVCTSSNAHQVVAWAQKCGRRVFFVPDEHLGRNTAHKLGLAPERVFALPDPRRGQIVLSALDLERLDRAELILWGSSCGVHTIFTPAMVRHWQARGYRVLIHPESPLETVLASDGAGSTNYLWSEFERAPRGAKLAIGTEGHFVRNAHQQGAARGIEVVHLAEIPGSTLGGCGCATMSRNDPPHLAGMLDLLRQGRAPEINRVLAGDVMNELTMGRERLPESERLELVREARVAMERMIAVVEGRA